MNDKSQSNIKDQDELSQEVDPLDELARIVSGETEEANSDVNFEVNAPKPEDILAAASDNKPSELSEPAYPQHSEPDNLEAELLKELGSPDSPIETPAVEDVANTDLNDLIAQSPEPEVENIQTVDVMPEPVVSEPIVPIQAGASFDDALLSAIDEELAVNPDTPNITEPDLSIEPSVEKAELFTATEDGAQDIDKLLADELETFEQPSVPEPKPTSLPETVEISQNPPSSSFDEIADLEAELSSAFDEDAKGIDNEALDVAEAELDFEAAFAQELSTKDLNMAELDAPAGWDDMDTVAANAAFAEAALPDGSVNNNATEIGHAGVAATMDDPNRNAAPINTSQEGGGSRKYAIVALIIALFAGVITAGYGVLGGGETGASGEAPIIEASTDPVKVKPEDPGGRVVANQNNASYEKVEGNELASVEQENLVSQTEEPAIIDKDNLPDNAALKGEERLSTTEGGLTESENANNAVKPRVVQVVTVKPDGTIVKTPVAKPLPATNNQIASVDTQATPVPTEPIKLGEPIDGASSSGELQIPTASPLPKPEPVIIAQPDPPEPKQVQQAAVQQPATPAPVAKSEWHVQVSSQRSPEAAQQSFNNMRNRFSVLQGRSMSVQRANVNGATYFRVRVQTASKADASQLCNSLTAAGGSCFVTR